MRVGLRRRQVVLPGIIALLLLLSPGAPVTATAPETATSSLARAAPATPPLVPEYSGCGGVNQPVVNADYEQQVVDLVNAQRANNSLPPYKRVTALDEAARYHSADMGQDNYFDHDTYDRAGGNLVYVCDTWTRIGTYYTDANAMAENIAYGYSTPQSVMNAWMNSTGHRNNILSINNREIGVGYATGGGAGQTPYWTQDFGRRRNVYPLIINRDAASTGSRHVSLYIYGSFQQMRLKNDNGSWDTWQPFQNNVTWTLGNAVGTRTVTAELKSGSTVVTISDTIYLTVADIPQLGNLPDDVLFLYSIAEARFTPATQILTPLNVNTDDAITWTLAKTGSWFTVSPSSGTSPQSFQITPDSFATGIPVTYTGSLTVIVSGPPGTSGSPHRIDLTLRVIDASLDQVYLPAMLR
jgi:uncharacterized protein YkwD